MDEKTIKSYADRLVNMTTVVPYDHSAPHENSHLCTHYSIYTNEFVYMVDARRYQRELLKPLLESERWGEKCTEAYIQEALWAILRQALQLGRKGVNGRTQKAFAELVTKVENYSRRYTIYIPLSNIQLDIETLTIGDVTLFTMTEALFEEIVAHVTKFMKNEEALDSWLRNLQNTVCAKYICQAYDDRARERGIEACEQVLELLRFALQRTGQDRLSITIGLLHEVPWYIRTIPALSPEGVSLSGKVMGPLTPFNIDQTILNQLEEVGIFKVASLFQQDIETDSFHDVLLRGIHWFSNAQKQRIKENQFLNLTTCLETFLGKGEDITQTVACGVAVVLKATQEERRTLWRREKDLYEHRSCLSHGNRSTMLESDLADLWSIAGEFLACTIQRMDEFSQQKDALKKWIKAQKFEP